MLLQIFLLSHFGCFSFLERFFSFYLFATNLSVLSDLWIHIYDYSQQTFRDDSVVCANHGASVQAAIRQIID